MYILAHLAKQCDLNCSVHFSIQVIDLGSVGDFKLMCDPTKLITHYFRCLNQGGVCFCFVAPARVSLFGLALLIVLHDLVN